MHSRFLGSPLRSAIGVSTAQGTRYSNIGSLFNGWRYYHSYDYPSSSARYNDVERAILSAAYSHVPEYGFSQQALTLGARDSGYLDISPSVLPDGPFSLIRYHLVDQRQNLVIRSEKILDLDFQPNIEKNVGALTWERLMGNMNIIHRWQEALAIMAQPSYLPSSLEELASLSDDIWFLAGDKSVDPSWYTKRAALSMVYSSSELFMTNDKSPGFIATNKFLHRRLNEAEVLGSSLGSLSQWAGFTLKAGINVLRSKGIPA